MSLSEEKFDFIGDDFPETAVLRHLLAVSVNMLNEQRA